MKIKKSLERHSQDGTMNESIVPKITFSILNLCERSSRYTRNHINGAKKSPTGADSWAPMDTAGHRRKTLKMQIGRTVWDGLTARGPVDGVAVKSKLRLDSSRFNRALINCYISIRFWRYTGHIKIFLFGLNIMNLYYRYIIERY